MRSTRFLSLLVCSVLIAVLGIGGCGAAGGSGGGGNTSSVSVSLTPSSTQAIDQGQTINLTATVMNDSSNKGVIWTISGPGSLTNQTTTSATYNAGTTSTGNATVTATSGAYTSKTAVLTITVTAAPSITTTSLPGATQGVAYNQTIAVSGGAGAKTFSTSSGSLPAGLSLNSSTGAITGTPNASAVASNFTVKVTDTSTAGAQSATQALSVTIAPAAALQITTTTLPGGIVGSTYSQAVTVTGGIPAYTYSVSVGALPAGLTVNGATGIISGTPTTQQSNVAFTILVTDTSNPMKSASQAYTVTIGAALSINTTALPLATTNTSYSTTITAAGGAQPYTFSLDAASPPLPIGLTLNASNNQATITGMPVASGTVRIIVDVHDGEAPAGFTQAPLYLVTIPPCPTGGNLGLVNGGYAFLMQGFSPDGPVSFIGYFNADGQGNLTAGEEDLNPNETTRTTSPIGNGTYTVGPDNRGCVTFTYGGGAVAVNFRFAASTVNVGVAGGAHFVALDNSARAGSGIIRQRTGGFGNGNSAFFGNFAFGVAAPANSTRGRYAAAGMLSLTAGNGTISGVMDTNDNGNINNTGTSAYPATPRALTGTYSVDGVGRSVVTLTTAQGTSNNILYVISPTDAFLMNIDDQTHGNSAFAGEMLQQAVSLSNSSLNGVSILGIQGALTTVVNNTAVVTPKVQVGAFTAASGNTSFTLSSDTNNGGVLGTSTLSGGSYAVAASGRVTLSNAGTTPPIFYLVNTNQGFVLGTDNIVSSGLLALQSAASLSGTTLLALGTVAPTDSSTSVQSGLATLMTGNVTETTDLVTGGTMQINQAFSGTYAIGAGGRGTISTAGGTQSIFYVVSPTDVFLMQAKTGDTNPYLATAEQ